MKTIKIPLRKIVRAALREYGVDEDMIHRVTMGTVGYHHCLITNNGRLVDSIHIHLDGHVQKKPGFDFETATRDQLIAKIQNQAENKQCEQDANIRAREMHGRDSRTLSNLQRALRRLCKAEQVPDFERDNFDRTGGVYDDSSM